MKDPFAIGQPLPLAISSAELDQIARMTTSPATENIPRIIHQTWKSQEIPPDWKPFQESWQSFHPDWEYRLWTDKDLRDLVQKEHPELLERFDAFPLGVQRADMARYVILKHFGGFYVDLDFQCFRSLDDLVDDASQNKSRALLVRTRQTGGDPLSNAIMASVPQHALWDRVIERMKSMPWPSWYVGLPFIRHVYTIWATGPQVLDGSFKPNEAWTDDIGFLPSEKFLPYKPLEEMPIKDFDGYAIHHYSCSWGGWDTRVLTWIEHLIYRFRR